MREEMQKGANDKDDEGDDDGDEYDEQQDIRVPFTPGAKVIL